MLRFFFSVVSVVNIFRFSASNVMIHAPADLLHRLKRHKQEHVLAGWDALAVDVRRALVEQLAGVDFEELEALYARRSEPHTALPERSAVRPLPVVSPAELTAEDADAGEAELRAGRVAALVVAGGQGSRLGFAAPKGMFPIGPNGESLFQIHAEKVLALQRRYDSDVPLLVMTSPATHVETVRFFESNHHFGLPADDVHFFQQGTMPALSLDEGKLLMEVPGKLFTSPNGHGGTLTALADTGLLGDLKMRGIRSVFYFQVDNPLVNIGDSAFIGRHIRLRSESSSKVVYKECPEEKVGLLAEVAGRCSIIEYSDLPMAWAEERTAAGELVFRAGNPAIHLFDVNFLARITSGEHRLGFHIARKKVAHFDAATGTAIEPTTENALKFELFIFDALPLAERTLAVSTERRDEFAPLKNATGQDSPERVRAAMLDFAKRHSSR